MGTCRPAVIAEERARGDAAADAVPSGSFRAVLKEVDMPTDAGGVGATRAGPNRCDADEGGTVKPNTVPRPIDEPATLPIFYSRRSIGWEGENGRLGGG